MGQGRGINLIESILKRNKDIYLWCQAYCKEHPGTDPDSLRGLIYKQFGRHLVQKSYEMDVVASAAAQKPCFV